MSATAITECTNIEDLSLHCMVTTKLEVYQHGEWCEECWVQLWTKRSIDLYSSDSDSSINKDSYPNQSNKNINMHLKIRIQNNLHFTLPFASDIRWTHFLHEYLRDEFIHYYNYITLALKDDACCPKGIHNRYNLYSILFVSSCIARC